MTQIEKLWSDVEAADFLGLHPKTVQRMARCGELPAYRIGRYWRFRASELDTWLKSVNVRITAPKTPSAERRIQ